MTGSSSPRGLWSFLVPSYLLLLWVVASLSSRARGGVTFLVGLGLLLGALAAFRRGRRRPLYAAYYLMLMAATCGAGLELLLRLAPGAFGGRAASVAFSGYHWYQRGIYRLDLHRGPVLKPDTHRSMYWNGHWWRHDTNADGYRGAALARADAVFLGDSMIYGHGVEQADTLPSRFEARTSLATANLGQQGACMLQSLATLQALGPRLRPRYVFVCTHPTDVEDALDLYGVAELRRFVDQGAWPLVVREKYRPPAPWDPLALWAAHLALPLESAALPGALLRDVRDRLRSQTPPPPAPGHWRPSPEDVAGPYAAFGPRATDRQRLAWEAHRRALAEIGGLARELGARLVLFDIGFPNDLSRAVEGVAHELGSLYSTAGRQALLLAFSGVEIYLADDGHWSPTGNAVVARGLARTLELADDARVVPHGAKARMSPAERRSGHP